MDTKTSIFTADVARAVASAMEEKGATQLGVSEATGIPRTTLIRRLAGVSPFTVAELAAIANTIGVEVDTFVTRAAA